MFFDPLEDSGQWLPGRSLEDVDLPTPQPPLPRATRLNRHKSADHSEAIAAAAAAAVQLQHQSRPQLRRNSTGTRLTRIYDDPAVTAGYATVPVLEVDELPRGGVSVETVAVGRIQFGIPPETIKDSMLLGLEVPRVYIVPTERFCSDLGPALGINLAEFEFPAYFNYFVRQKKICLIVDSKAAERNIRNVFEETLLGPKQFRNKELPLPNNVEDFCVEYPLDARPDFFKEFAYFRECERTAEYDELQTDMLLDFLHFDKSSSSTSSSDQHNQNGSHQQQNGLSHFAAVNAVNGDIGVPPPAPRRDYTDSDDASVTKCDHQQHTRNASREYAREYGHRSHGKLDLSDLPSSRKATRFAEELPNQHHHQQQQHPGQTRRASLESVESMFSASSAVASVDSFRSDYTSSQQPWRFSQLLWLGEVATVWPTSATPEQIAKRSVPRVEVIKMPGSGTEYVIHDVNANNIIIGKARLKGHVHVPEEISLEGFRSSINAANIATLPEELEDIHCGNLNGDEDHSASSIGVSLREEWGIPAPTGILSRIRLKVPLFHPPSFGVTVLGNSHGFDKNGSTSGYVLWVNGRGIMIDPPPYSSTSLEKEGIHPQMIFGLMITHCHADHDAGAFQKILTGSRLSIITTPSIYDSFIRKYSALSGLTPALLRQSHRFRPAIIGKPLKFQGATFHFTYTLHTIPCISFKVEWRGRSMVFTGDHLNLPPLLDELESKVRVCAREKL